MARSISCHLLEPWGTAEETYRRFTYSSTPSTCTHSWGHDAKAIIDSVPFPLENGLEGASRSTGMDKHDPRWPTKCESCGYEFIKTDEWQVNRHRKYLNPGTGDLTVLSRAPVGSMWYAPWLEGIKGFENSPDGNVLVVRTPGGDWVVDGPAKGGGGWSRTGTPPQVTANPSILMGPYHGWLKNGVLEEC